MKNQNELEGDFSDFIKDSLRENKEPGERAVIDAFKKALDTTTPDQPGDPRDFKEVKKEKLEW
jgi:hypothetical protein